MPVADQGLVVNPGGRIASRRLLPRPALKTPLDPSRATTAPPPAAAEPISVPLADLRQRDLHELEVAEHWEDVQPQFSLLRARSSLAAGSSGGSSHLMAYSAASPTVSQEPDPVSPRNRSRANSEPDYRSRTVKHLPDQHSTSAGLDLARIWHERPRQGLPAVPQRARHASDLG